MSASSAGEVHPAAVLPTSSETPDQSVPSATADNRNASASLATAQDEITDASTAEGSRSPPHSPSVREIHKNSWLKRMPSSEKWAGRFSKTQKAEKFWVVFCVHDDKEAFLEFYENRRSAYSHKPLSSVSLAHCLHISPTIVVQENDHEFVITLDSQVIRLAASTREQMLEWMDTMRTKLRELGVLEPKDNLYSKEPITTPRSTASSPSVSEAHPAAESQAAEELNRLSLRDPNSPLPPVPASSMHSNEDRVNVTSTSTVVYIRNPPSVSSAPLVTSVPVPLDQVISNNHRNAQDRLPSQSTPQSVFTFDFVNSVTVENPVTRHSTNSVSSEPIISNSSRGATSQTAFSVPNTPLSEESSSVYEPLFYPAAGLSSHRQLTCLGVRNPNYENPPVQRNNTVESVPILPPRISADQRRMSSSMVNEIQEEMHRPVRTRGLSNLSSNSEPSLNSNVMHNSSNARREANSTSDNPTSGNPVSVLQSASASRPRNVLEPSQSTPSRRARPPSEEGPPPYNSIASTSSHFRNLQPTNLSNETPIPVDESGRPLSLREAQVLKLQAEIGHKSGVRLVLRKKDCINAIALVECFGHVWVAGWKQKEHPLLHNTFHIGDRIISIAGQRIHNVQEAHKAIKHQSAIVEFIVRRIPLGKILAIKRECEGQDLGIVREGGTAEIKEVKPDGLASRYGLSAKAPSVDGNNACNWSLTEINHRPLNLFFKDNEVHDRLNAVGLDISILVQPVDLVKNLKKQLKTLRSYKDYVIQ